MSAFWDDLAEDLDDPEYLAEHEAAALLIETLDGIANA